MAGCDWYISTIILCFDTGITLFTEIWIICWAEPFTFLIARTTSSVGTMGVELVCMSREDSIISTIESVTWCWEAETLDGNTAVDGVGGSRDGDGGSNSTVDSSSEREGIDGTGSIDGGDTGWRSGASTTCNCDCWWSRVSRSSGHDLCKSTNGV